MTITKKKKTGRYEVRFKTPHGQKSLSTKATTRKEAEQVAKSAKIQELEAAATAGRLTADVVGMITAGRKVTCEQALAEWVAWSKTVGQSRNTIRNHEGTLDLFMAHQKCGKLPPAALTIKHVDDFVNQPGTMKLRYRLSLLTSLSAFFDFCSAKAWAFGNPARLCRVKMDRLTHAQKETKQRNPFTDEEIKLLLKETEPGTFFHTAIAIGRYLGLRLGDIAQIEWDCFAHPGNVTVWTEKRDRRVSLPLEPRELADAIAAVPPNNTKHLFPKEAALMQDMTNRARLSVYFGRILARNGIKGKSFHDLRAAYATECHRKGIPMEHISTSLGHAQQSTTQGYIRKEKR